MNFEFILTRKIFQGFNPSQVKADEIFYYDAKRNLYEKVTSQVYDDIMSAKLRF